MGTPGCGGFAASAGTGSSRSLGPTVVTTAASAAGESLWSDPLDGPGSGAEPPAEDRKSTRLNSSHGYISYAVFCLKKNKSKTFDFFWRHTFSSPVARGSVGI